MSAGLGWLSFSREQLGAIVLARLGTTRDGKVSPVSGHFQPQGRVFSSRTG
jgi:hypothetical protein